MVLIIDIELRRALSVCEDNGLWAGNIADKISVALMHPSYWRTIGLWLFKKT
jgi:hypothetical protein